MAQIIELENTADEMSNKSMFALKNASNTNFTDVDQTSSLESNIGAENLYPALVECFGLIALGYVAGR